VLLSTHLRSVIRIKDDDSETSRRKIEEVISKEGIERFSESCVGEERQLLSTIRYVGDNDKATAGLIDGE
jgi:Mn-dependent DtxR family transcriptional regulator